ncbi:hypothetical protein ACFLIN_03880 [Corynebacterium kutscheri]|uniref:hypothetical protein n=1 Tax=Corynebacterium kutscheri TaxID=35755 RepID=UPI0037C03C88
MDNTELLNLVESVLKKRKLMLTIQEFAAVTGYPYKRVWQACREGLLEYQQKCVGGRIHIDYREMKKILDGEVII